MKRIPLKTPNSEVTRLERFRAIVQSELYYRKKDSELDERDYLLALFGSEDDVVMMDLMNSLHTIKNREPFSWEHAISWVYDHWPQVRDLLLHTAKTYHNPDKKS